MRADGIVRRFDDFGRIVIPRELRRQIFGTSETEGIKMEIFIDKDNIILRKYEENKSNDVCEWKKCSNPSYPWRVGCEVDLISNKQGDYCPYCGKKIKVVE